MHRHVVVAEVAIEQRDLDVLPFAGAFAMEQRRPDGAQRMNSRGDVAHSDLRQRGRAVAFADHAQYAGICAADKVIAGTIRERTALPKGRDRTHDDFRIERSHGLVAKSQSRDHFRRVVLHQDIDLGDELADNRSRRGIFKVEAQTSLATVMLHVVRAASVAQIRQAARYISVRREFDLHYLGTHFGHVASRGRSGQHLGEIQYPIALEHALCCLRHLSLRLPVRAVTIRTAALQTQALAMLSPFFLYEDMNNMQSRRPDSISSYHAECGS